MTTRIGCAAARWAATPTTTQRTCTPPPGSTPAAMATAPSYDAAGNMTARAPSESASQQQLTWDNEGRLTSLAERADEPHQHRPVPLRRRRATASNSRPRGWDDHHDTYVGDLEQVATSWQYHHHHDVLLRGGPAHRPRGQWHALLSRQRSARQRDCRPRRQWHPYRQPALRAVWRRHATPTA